MNKLVTYTARAKMKAMIQSMNAGLANPKDRCVAIRITSHSKGGFEIEHMFSGNTKRDIIISSNPYIITDEYTLSLLNDGSIDFSYQDDEFIITRDTDVILAHA